jgi:aspartate aminotransferase
VGRHVAPRYQQLSKTFAYLRECVGSRFDWTSAAATFEPATHIKAVAAKYFSQSKSLNRSPPRGEPALLKAIEDYFHRCGIKCSKENILIAPSTFQIVGNIYDLTKPAGKVLLPMPSFGYFVEQCELRGIQTALLPTDESTSWKITPEALEKALIINKPSIFLFTNPVNPTGMVYARQEVEGIAAVLKRHNVLTIADEVFKDVILNFDKKPYSLAAVEGIEDKVVTLNGVGKSRGLPSMFVSFCTAPRNIEEALQKEYTVSQQRTQQLVAAEALTDNPENRAYLDETSAKYRDNIALIKERVTRLNRALGKKFGEQREYVRPVVKNPDATNVYLLNFHGLRGKMINGRPLATGLDVAKFLQKKVGVAMVPYESFLMDAQAMTLRLILSRPEEELRQGFSTISEAFEKLVEPPHPQPHTTTPANESSTP